jgi:hypothetical protein
LAAKASCRINASKTKPAKLFAVFVVDTNETELRIPIRELRFNPFLCGAIAEVIQQSCCSAVAYLPEEEATALWREPNVKS